jgi:hypothetical protein
MNTTHRILFGLLAALSAAQAQQFCIQADNQMTVGPPWGGRLASYGTSYYFPACNEIYYTVDITVPGGLHFGGVLFIGGDFDQHPSDPMTCASASISVSIQKRVNGGGWKHYALQNAKGTWLPNLSYCQLGGEVVITPPPANETDQYRVMVLPEQAIFQGNIGAQTPEPAVVFWGVHPIT